ncbi:FadR family transcriptional regulator [Peribacillus cavernae]|uniref:FadR family transcriptional regulator n=1 Tax=Peribacillus cavernae TaxID=1674310 RepID=A0A3S0U5H2_9BACI|nr:FadR/GntR family transcriptional regulator [Peribacillus cavernae]RUQ30617.1 FadR family transcriptional regulator [Peribacillus cavernae]
MDYKRIKPKKIYEIVAEQLHESIKSGELKPGARLDSIEKLAENFDVGRSAIREALSALRTMGLVEMRQGEGTYVKQFDPSLMVIPLSNAILMNKEDIGHLLEVRKILEAGAVTAAANNRTEKDIEDMEIALIEMKSASGDHELGEKADLSFHMAIAVASKNPLLVTLMNQVSDMMVETMRETRRILLYSKEKTMDTLYQEHVKILEAIKAKDGDSAREAMRHHLDNVEEILTDFFLDKGNFMKQE